MSEHRLEIPIFPLHTVLFPQSRLQLHIFEPRYRQMVTDCISSGGHFGVSLIRDGSEIGGGAEPYLVGTLARILDIHTYSDGRFDITILGVSRFRAREFVETKPYTQAFVEAVVDGDSDEPSELEKISKNCRQLFSTILQQQVDLAGLSLNVILSEDAATLSYEIANMIELPLIRKQAMLEMTSTSERLMGLIGLLEQLNRESESPTRKLSATDLKDWITVN